MLRKLELVLNMLKKEHERLKMQRRLREQVEQKVQERNREHLLREQMKIIRKELGLSKDEHVSLKDKYTERLKVGAYT